MNAKYITWLIGVYDLKWTIPHKNIDASMGNNPIKALVYHITRKKINEKVIFLYDFKNNILTILIDLGWIKFPNRPVINWFRILQNVSGTIKFIWKDDNLIPRYLLSLFDLNYVTIWFRLLSIHTLENIFSSIPYW